MKKKIISFFAFLILIAGSAQAQTKVEQDALKQLAIDFINDFNSGDTAQYHRFLNVHHIAANDSKDLLRRYLNTFNAIGKVAAVAYTFPSAQMVKITAQEEKFDSWWEFTLNTTPNQVFLNRTVLPIPYPTLALTKGKLEVAAFKTTLNDYITQKLGSNFSGNVWIMHKDKWIFKQSYGKDHKGISNSSTTLFNLASMGKMFTAISILKLRDEKKLSLDDSVGKFLPQLKNKEVSKVTISQLLTHTSGMGDYFETPLFQQLKDKLRVSEDYLPFIEATDLSFLPGSDWRYSNTGFSLLGIIIEKVSGKTYPDYLSDHIFTPAKMTATQAGNGDGGSLSTSEDLLRFATQLCNGKLLNASSTKATLYNTVNHHYGYGTEHQQLGTEHIVGHSGSLENLNTELNIYTKSGYVVIILSNIPPPFAHHLSNKIKGLLIRN